MVDTLSRIFCLLVTVKLGESIVHDNYISHDKFTQIDHHRQKLIFFLQEQLLSIVGDGRSSSDPPDLQRSQRRSRGSATPYDNSR